MTAALYEQVWDDPRYAEYSPGEHLAQRFVEIAKPDSLILDFGCGSGKGTMMLHALTGQPVLGLDWAANAPRTGIEFKVQDLAQPIEDRAEYGYCTDVMEHIAPEDVDKVLLNILTAARKVFFAISTVPDHFGKLVGEPLHLTVQPHAWWRERLEAHGCKVLWEQEAEHAALFYVSAYATGQDFAEICRLNTAEGQLAANIRANLALGLQEVAPHGVQDQTVILLAGGPSLADFEDEIVTRGRAGEIIVTVNGTYNWLLDRGVKPAAQVMVDARAHNKRFISPVVDYCKYLLSSLCDTEGVKSVPAEQVWLWHSGDNQLVKRVFDEYAEESGVGREWYPVYGGTTVILRALTLLAMLGFRNIEVFGWDSCLMDGKHHAYDQPENNGGSVFDVIVDGKVFKCNPWMIVQANEVPKCVKYILGHIDGFNLEVRGYGLIAQIFNHAAMMAEKE